MSDQPESQPLTSGGNGISQDQISLAACQTCQHVSELFADDLCSRQPHQLSRVTRSQMEDCMGKNNKLLMVTDIFETSTNNHCGVNRPNSGVSTWITTASRIYRTILC